MGKRARSPVPWLVLSRHRKVDDMGEQVCLIMPVELLERPPTSGLFRQPVRPALVPGADRRGRRRCRSTPAPAR
jgi:hypothetical protein